MESERLERVKRSNLHIYERDKDDEILRERIFKLLNDSSLKSYNYVDAYYYDFSALPDKLKGKFYRDMYLLFGINDLAQIVTKWVERYDLDSHHSVIDGKVIKPKC